MSALSTIKPPWVVEQGLKISLYPCLYTQQQCLPSNSLKRKAACYPLNSLVSVTGAAEVMVVGTVSLVASVGIKLADYTLRAVCLPKVAKKADLLAQDYAIGSVVSLFLGWRALKNAAVPGSLLVPFKR